MKKNGLLSTVVLILIFACLFFAAPSISMATKDAEPESVKFGIFPYQAPKALVETYGPVAMRLEKVLGKKVKIVTAPDPRSYFERAESGEYDILLVSPTVYYKLRAAGYKVIARGIPTFFGGVIVRNDSEIRKIEHLKGKSVAAIGEHSYAGYMFLRPQLEAVGIDPKQDLEFQFLGKVDTVILGVINKKYDAGLIRLDALDLPAFIEIRQNLRIVSRSPEIPQFPFVVKDSMDKATVAAVRATLTSFSADTPEELEILKSLQVKKIVEASDAEYDQFFEQIKDTDYFRKP